MTSRRIRVLVPPPVAVPRAALWIGLLLDRLAVHARPTPDAVATPRYATEAGQ
jgi:hypothetical protein